MRSLHAIGNAGLLRVGDGLFHRLEAQANLARHVAGAGVAHERFHRARLFRLIGQDPFGRVALAGLHRRPGRPEDNGNHRSTSLP